MTTPCAPVIAMRDADGVRAELNDAIAGGGGSLAVANRLCEACVAVLGVDGAAISLLNLGQTQGTHGSSSPLSKQLDEYQFTFGEGPCKDAVSQGRPVLVTDLHDHQELRWSAYSAAVRGAGVRAVFALPIALVSSHVGALDLFRNQAGGLSAQELTGALLAAELAALPLVDLATEVAGNAAAVDEQLGWAGLGSLERVEVYQATGMVMGQLGEDAAEALVRLRAHAFAQGMTASEVGWEIVERRLTLSADEPG